MKDLNKLAKEVYEANKAKGFHDKEYSVEHMMCLVISELMEAVEADREGRMADAECVEALTKKTPRSLFDVLFKNGVKDTVEDELADAVIRLLDTAGALNVKISIDNSPFTDIVKVIYTDKGFTEAMYSIIRVFMVSPLSVGYRISRMIANIEILCEVMDIDLWQHVELKLKYNKLRPHRHGKEY